MGFTSPPNPQQYQALVWDIVRQVPYGEVATYGQIAGMIPAPGSLNLKDYEAFGARWVGSAMAKCPDDVPWQRVINSQGKISLRSGAEKQVELLKLEGVHLDDKGRVNFEHWGWNGPDPEWCRARGLFAARPLGKPQLPLF